MISLFYHIFEALTFEDLIETFCSYNVFVKLNLVELDLNFQQLK
jgi:hypothetical protein